MKSAVASLSGAWLGLVLACSADAEVPRAPHRPPLVGAQAGPLLARVDLPGPAPRDRPPGYEPAAENARCEGCHAEIASEWRRSLHRESWTDPLFLSAYVLEPQPFCRACHAPEAPPELAPSAAAKQLGVGCVTCHVSSSDIVGVEARSGQTHHPVLGDPRLATAAACEGCHDFDFPFDAGVPMQSTVREHAALGASAPSCQACHMPEVVGALGRPHRRHDFSTVGDPAMLASAVEVSAERIDGRAIAVELRRGNIAHALPTGDLFRRLQLHAEVLDDTGEVIARAQPRSFARSFATEHAGSVMRRRPTGDTRLFVDPRERERRVRIDLPPEAEGRAVRYRLVHLRMDAPMAELFGVPGEVLEVSLHTGVIGPARR